jgi:hypothetical protein
MDKYMKKILYSLVLVVLGLASCTTWDDPQQENYGDGPATSIALATTTDSTFTFTVTPDSGSLYYSYVVVESSEVSVPAASTLLKGAVSGVTSAVQSTADVKSVTVNMRNAKTNAPLCKPNTTYQIYAVAASDKGVVGVVKSATVTTSDGNAPTFASFKTKDSLTAVTFSESVKRDTGAVTAVYYKEWDISNPVSVKTDSLNVAISGSVVNLTVKGVPAGAYVVYSWNKGAFVDSKGNPCPAFSSTLNMTTGSFTGVYIHLATVAWSIADENITSPESESLIGNASEFQGVLVFDHDIYRNEEELTGGELSVVYSNSKRTSTIKLAASDWSISKNTLTFTLPETPAVGDIVTVKIAEDAIYDVCGNGNKAFTSTKWWKYFPMTKSMVLGTFKFTYYSAFDSTPELYDGGNITISEDASVTNGLIIKNLYMDGSEVKGRYDLSTGKIYINAYEELGITTTSKGNKYGLVTLSIAGDKEIPFTVNTNGIMISKDLAIAACDEAYTEIKGTWEKCSTATFTPVSSSAKAKYSTRVSVKSSGIKTSRISVTPRHLKRIRK